MRKNALSVLASELFSLGHMPITESTVDQVRSFVNIFGMDAVYACCKPYKARSGKRLLNILESIDEAEYARCSAVQWYYTIGYTNKNGEYYFTELREEVIDVIPIINNNYPDAMEMARAMIEKHASSFGIKKYAIITS